MNTTPFYPCMSVLPKAPPKAPPVPEEPLENMPAGPLVCDICGKTFKSHSQLDRHKMSEHEKSEEAHG
jgi:Zinc finger, C2H2 type.